MGIRTLLQKLATPAEDLDAANLKAFCAEKGHIAIRDVAPRMEVTVVGQISSVRIVPHAGSPWLEATLSDGDDSIVAMWTGRKSIAGVKPGKRLVIKGRSLPIAPGSHRLKMMNPAYELLG